MTCRRCRPRVQAPLHNSTATAGPPQMQPCHQRTSQVWLKKQTLHLTAQTYPWDHVTPTSGKGVDGADLYVDFQMSWVIRDRPITMLCSCTDLACAGTDCLKGQSCCREHLVSALTVLSLCRAQQLHNPSASAAGRALPRGPVQQSLGSRCSRARLPVRHTPCSVLGSFMGSWEKHAQYGTFQWGPPCI